MGVQLRSLTGAFSYCSSLETIIIPSRVTSIGNDAFESCANLTIYCEAESKPNGWADNWNSGRIAYYGCVLEDGVIYNVSGGVGVVIPQPTDITTANIKSSIVYKGNTYNVTSIVESAFSNCSSLKTAVIPNSITSIGKYAFYKCGSLTYNVKDGLKYLGNETNKYLYLAMAEQTITSAKIEDSCKFMDKSAFYGCDLLTSLIIGNGITSIADEMFILSSLENVVVGNSVTKIGEWAFAHCGGLRSIVIPKSVTNIGYFAFYNCSLSLTIYCEAESQPSGWDSSWREPESSVVWGYNAD